MKINEKGLVCFVLERILLLYC